MKQTIYGVVGKGKLGSLLLKRPNFVFIDCDITNENSILKTQKDFDVVVNCAAVSSIDDCERDDSHAFRINVRGAEKLMAVYGNRVLNVGSDYVFGGWKLFPPTENSTPNPINVYGITKIMMENFSYHYRAKTIRLSRTIDGKDSDISQYLHSLYFGEITEVPSFFYRNYLTRHQAVDGIEYFVRNFNKMPSIVNYGQEKPQSFYTLMYDLALGLNFDASLLRKQKKYNDKMTPRPKKAGFSTRLAKRLGFPMYNRADVVRDFLNRHE